MKMTVTITVLSWVLRITAAIILLQTLFFKFTAAPESVYIFKSRSRTVGSHWVRCCRADRGDPDSDAAVYLAWVASSHGRDGWGHSQPPYSTRHRGSGRQRLAIHAGSDRIYLFHGQSAVPSQ